VWLPQGRGIYGGKGGLSSQATPPLGSSSLKVSTGEIHNSLPFGIEGSMGTVACGEEETESLLASARKEAGSGSGVLAEGGRGSGGGERSLPAGSTLGDWPTGSLTTLPFVVPSSTLTFLVGGGCDTRFVYVTLTVKGVPVRKSSGSCSEGSMRPVVWDTGPWVGTFATISIVDAADSGPWGYISVDEFLWSEPPSKGGAPPSTPPPPPPVGSVFAYLLAPTFSGDFQAGGGRSGTTGSGSEWFWGGRGDGGGVTPSLKRLLEAIPSREGPLPALPCTTVISTSSTIASQPSLYPIANCSWYLEAHLKPQDGVPGERFGASLALDGESGQVLVGSMGGGDGAGGVGRQVRRYSVSPALKSGQGWLLRGRVWGGVNFEGGLMGPWATCFGYEGGSVQGQPGQTGSLNAPPLFLSQPPSLSLIGFTALIGGLPQRPSPSNSHANSKTPPTVLAVDLRHALVSFSTYDWVNPTFFDSPLAASWAGAPAGLLPSAWLGSGYATVGNFGSLSINVREGSGGSSSPNTLLGHIVIPVYRAGASGFSTPGSEGALHVRYATEEGSALGVSARKGAACALLPRAARRSNGCGDFVLAAGEVHFAAGVSRVDILIQVMDDECDKGNEAVTFYLHLYSPGGGRIASPAASLKVSITEDDAGKPGNC